MTQVRLGSAYNDIFGEEEDEVDPTTQTFKELLIEQEIDRGLNDLYVPSQPINQVVESEDYDINEEYFTPLGQSHVDMDLIFNATNCEQVLNRSTWSELKDDGIRAGKLDSYFHIGADDIYYRPEFLKTGGNYYSIPESMQDTLDQNEELWVTFSLSENNVNMTLRFQDGRKFKHYHGTNNMCLNSDDMRASNFTILDLVNVDFIHDLREILNERLKTINADSPYERNFSSLPSLSTVEDAAMTDGERVERRRW